MDVKYINPFLAGTLEVLKKMAFVDAFAGKPYTKQDSIACGDVSGIIGITGGAVGSLAISFTESSILAIAGTMLGETYKDVCRDIFDTVGEITNMISGVARTYMEREGLTVYAAIPTVVYGSNHVIMHILKSPSIVIPFSTKYGQFFVDVCIKVQDPAEIAMNSTAGPINVVYRGEMPVGGQARHPAAPHAGQASPEISRVVPSPKTQAPPRSEPVKQNGPSQPLTMEEKIERAKENLKKLMAQRDEAMRALKEQPFMELKMRQNLKKLLPVYDEKIKRLKLDIQAIESIMGMDQKDIDDPKIGKHYQHY
ncbi:MAG: chemotaxis protein CheX [Syntrophales bacterium]|nr:chemotaxis protein CheX [Syntrophales bacterium]